MTIAQARIAGRKDGYEAAMSVSRELLEDDDRFMRVARRNKFVEPPDMPFKVTINGFPFLVISKTLFGGVSHYGINWREEGHFQMVAGHIPCSVVARLY